MTAAVTAYEDALRRGAARVVDRRGAEVPMHLHRWIAPAEHGDHDLLARCEGSTLDVGCGPGRMVAALAQRGVLAMGIDISPLAVELTQQRGGTAICRDVYADVPGAGRWNHLLLADGNIGIGGDPVRLLSRCRDLIASDGTVLLDVKHWGYGFERHDVRFELEGAQSDWFAWSWVGLDALAVIASAAGFRVSACWPAHVQDPTAGSEHEGWQAELTPTDEWRPPRQPLFDLTVST